MGEIDIAKLPMDIRDVIELKEATDQTFWRFCACDYTEWFWNLLTERADPGVEHSVIISIFGGQGSGKSMTAISICSFLDPSFDVKRIYFGYEKLVNDRASLQQNTSVLVDEQAQVFGLDAHRVMIVLTQLKEQLRKKSIHFVFCSPVLYPEHETSMYILETMFIDYEAREVYAALKTRDELTLGHVRIPHPLKVLEDGAALTTKQFIDEYQAKKDSHLETVLGNAGEDKFEIWAKNVIENPMFKRAEKIYVSRVGYIPQNTLIQLINKIMPDFNAGVVPLEIAQRIKLNKELSGKWDVPVGSVRRQDRAKTSGQIRK
jgi:ABC-type dipeptide/oligopeptide/nickel transport system ATPase component